MARAREDYVEYGKAAIMELVRQEGAVLPREIEAKIADVKWPSIPTRVDPHNLTTAITELVRNQWLVRSDPIDASGTRLLLPVDDRRKKALIRRATSRRKVLHKRLERWARASSRYPNGPIGEAGERVARRSLAAAVVSGVRPVLPGAAEVATLFDEPIPGGPLDTAAWVDVLDPLGRATGSILCPIEVKNIRHWVYPDAAELFQVLHKAAQLQVDHQDELEICPVLMTRERSWTVDQMSRDIGFRIFDVHKQFVLPIADVDPDQVQEVRDELGYFDLTRTDDADETVINLFRGSLRTSAPRNAETWHAWGSQLVDHYEILRDSSVRFGARRAAMDDLRMAADELGVWGGNW